MLGANGCGKTTLLKILMGQEAPTGGTFRFGANIEVGYYDQAQSGLDPEKTVLDEVWDACPDKTQTEVRNALAVFLFFGDDIYKQIKKLSGGEKARVLLLKLMLSAANFLILDEPTNHLDIAAKEALEQALSGYEGTLLIVSHDRYFINKMANKIYDMQQNQVTVYHGNYDYYLQKSLLTAQTAAAEEKPKQENEYFIEKEKRAQKRRLLGKISRLEDEIAQAEQQAAAILKSLESPEIASDYEKLTVASQELEQAQNHIEKLMEQWEEAQGELEEP